LLLCLFTLIPATISQPCCSRPINDGITVNLTIRDTFPDAVQTTNLIVNVNNHSIVLAENCNTTNPSGCCTYRYNLDVVPHTWSIIAHCCFAQHMNENGDFIGQRCGNNSFFGYSLVKYGSSVAYPFPYPMVINGMNNQYAFGSLHNQAVRIPLSDPTNLAGAAIAVSSTESGALGDRSQAVTMSPNLQYSVFSVNNGTGSSAYEFGSVNRNGVIYYLGRYPGGAGDDLPSFINDNMMVAGTAYTSNGYFRSTVWIFDSNTNSYQAPVDLSPQILGRAFGLTQYGLALFSDLNGVINERYIYHPSVGQIYWNFDLESYDYWAALTATGVIVEAIGPGDVFVSGCNISALYDFNPGLTALSGAGCADQFSQVAGLGSTCTATCSSPYLSSSSTCGYTMAWSTKKLCVYPSSSSATPLISSSSGMCPECFGSSAYSVMASPHPLFLILPLISVLLY